MHSIGNWYQAAGQEVLEEVSSVMNQVITDMSQTASPSLLGLCLAWINSPSLQFSAYLELFEWKEGMCGELKQSSVLTDLEYLIFYSFLNWCDIFFCTMVLCRYTEWPQSIPKHFLTVVFWSCVACVLTEKRCVQISEINDHLCIGVTSLGTKYWLYLVLISLQTKKESIPLCCVLAATGR